MQNYAGHLFFKLQLTLLVFSGGLGREDEGIWVVRGRRWKCGGQTMVTMTLTTIPGTEMNTRRYTKLMTKKMDI